MKEIVVFDWNGIKKLYLTERRQDGFSIVEKVRK